MKFLIPFLLAPVLIWSQNPNYPTDYFSSPLDIPLNLSGSFGELRNNHFHSGLDFKTNQKTGLNVLASAEGYVSRIKVSAFGYGKALYITHPNGYTTVYAHLENYAPKIEALVKKRQYQEKSFEVEIFLNSKELPISKNELIAFTGNTGGSGGPHLHYEIRDTKSENIINPLYFGFDKLIPDTKKPIINAIVVYPIGENSHANTSEIETTVGFSKLKDETYLADPIAANGTIGIGINTYDLFDNNYNKNGIFKIETYLNGALHYTYSFNNFSFNETRYINAFIDYGRMKKMNQWVQKLFFNNKYPLSIISKNENNGLINIKPGENYSYRIEISDYHNNKTIINIPIKHTNDLVKTKKIINKTKYYLKSNIENLYEEENASIYIPANTFYEDFYLDFKVQDSIVHFHNNSQPVHKNYSVSITNNNISNDLINKTYIATIEGNKKYYNKTEFKNNKFTTWTKNIGKFALQIDTIAPNIKPLNFTEGKWMSNEKQLKIQISDIGSGIKTYNAYFNDKWILMEYDYKEKLLFHNFDDGIVSEGKNNLKVVVTDNVGNSTTFETYIYRSQKNNE